MWVGDLGDKSRQWRAAAGRQCWGEDRHRHLSPYSDRPGLEMLPEDKPTQTFISFFFFLPFYASANICGGVMWTLITLHSELQLLSKKKKVSSCAFCSLILTCVFKSTLLLWPLEQFVKNTQHTAQLISVGALDSNAAIIPSSNRPYERCFLSPDRLLSSFLRLFLDPSPCRWGGNKARRQGHTWAHVIVVMMLWGKKKQGGKMKTWNRSVRQRRTKNYRENPSTHHSKSNVKV